MKSWFILLVLLVFLQTWTAAQTLTNEQEERIQRLEQVIEQQQQHIESLQQSLGSLPEIQSSENSSDYVENAVREYANTPNADDEERVFGYEDRGFFLRIPDFELYMGGLIQMGLGIFENDTFDNNSFYPHGVVMDFDVFMYQDWHARIEIAFDLVVEQNNAFQGGNGDNTQVWDAYIEYLGMNDGMNPTLAVRVGQFFVPFTISGQYNPDGGTSIWAEPFINGWAHGRDPGLMIWGVLSDAVEYKIGLFNGEGQTNMNADDDFMMAGSLRFFPWGYSEKSDSFFHIGVIRSRDNNLHDFGHVAAASLRTPWGRPVYDPRPYTGFDGNGDGIPDQGFSATQGWRTGVDVGFSFVYELNEIDSLYMESELMWMQWERDFATGRVPFLYGFGFHWGFQFKHNLTPDVPGAGIYPLFKISYSDVDSDSDDPVPSGQNMWVYTLGLGYCFNEHFRTEFNWVMADLEMHSEVGIPIGKTRTDGDGTDDTEHAWFLQFTAIW
jgi:hypothetical protein